MSRNSLGSPVKARQARRGLAAPDENDAPLLSYGSNPWQRKKDKVDQHAVAGAAEACSVHGAPSTTRPLQLIRMNPDTGTLEVGEEAAAVLRGIRTPLAVVAVCGRARTGKSYLLNQLLGQSEGFQLAHSYRPCTKGLWLWSEPIPRTGPDGAEYSLCLIDAEGVDAFNQTTQEGVQIFSLAVLLSSMLVYNQMGPIDEAALERLSLVTEITQHIRVHASSGAGDPSELSGFTPSFMWLLRDFYFELLDEGRKVAPREYLETALMPTSGAGSGVEAKNQIRASIKSLFPARDCFTLVRPCADERSLNHLDRLEPGKLRPEFAEGIAQLTRTLFARTHPKRVGSQAVTGPMLCGLAAAYCEAINAGAVPTIATAWQGVAEAECRRALAAGEATYRATFEQQADGATEPQALAAAHEAALAAAKAAYKAGAVGAPQLRAQFKQQLVEACSERYGLVSTRALAQAEGRVDALLAQGTQRLSTAARLFDSPDKVQAEFTSFLKEYAQQAAGPTKWQKLAGFLHRQYGVALTEQQERVQLAARQQAVADHERVAAAESKARAAEARAAAMERRLADLVRSEEMLRCQLQQRQQRQQLGSDGGGLACLGGCMGPRD